MWKFNTFIFYHFQQCHFFEDDDSIIIFRNFGQCITIVVADPQENELVAYEFLGLAFTLFQNYFGKFMERNILNNVDKLHMILEEVVINGEIVETSSKNVLGPLLMFDNLNAKWYSYCLTLF